MECIYPDRLRFIRTVLFHFSHECMAVGITELLLNKVFMLLRIALITNDEVDYNVVGTLLY